MSYGKSKLISSTPDYFVFDCINSTNVLREAIKTVAQNAGNYGKACLAYTKCPGTPDDYV